MSFQWLQMRISEEKDRREREAGILQRLPRALDEVHEALQDCVEAYREAFGEESADLVKLPGKLRVTVRTERNGEWQQTGRLEISTDTAVPGFQIDKGAGGDPYIIEVGMLPGDKLYYRDRAKDQYVTMEELTRRVMDRALFPNLNEER